MFHENNILVSRTTSASIASYLFSLFFFFQAEDGIRDRDVTGVQTCALPICRVSDCELMYFARVLGISPSDLFPRKIVWREVGPRFQTSRRISLFPARGDKSG